MPLMRTRIEEGGFLPLPSEVLEEVGWKVGDAVQVKILGNQIKLSKINHPVDLSTDENDPTREDRLRKEE